MTRRETILANVLQYNKRFLLDHAAMPVNANNEKRIVRLYQVIGRLQKRMKVDKITHGSQIEFEY